MPVLTIDGIEVEVEKGTSILQACEKLGIEIPRFCYHDRLSVPANCRMCLVDLEKAPKPVASCAMPCGDGMVVHTKNEKVQKARKGVMEFLLINHPLDCPICDQGGECDLQDQAVAYGFDRTRYAEAKRAVKDKELGPLIKTIMTRCIHCTRCVRFGEEIAGVPDMGLLNRGADVEIGTYVEKAVASELSGNMIDVCPVGALTSKPYAFHARPWELKKTHSIDVMDAVGSNIRVDVKGREVMRVLPSLHEGINEEWISDKTRFSYDGLKYRRLDRPYVRNKKGKLEEATWEEAFDAIFDAMKKVTPEQMAAIVGDMADCESIKALKDLMVDLGVTNLDCRIDGADLDASNRGSYLFNTTIEGLDEADAILIIGANPRVEATMVNARIKKANYNRKVPVALIGKDQPDLTYPYEYLGAGAESVEALLKARSGFAKTLKDAQNPVIILGAGALTRSDAQAVQAVVATLAEKVGAIRDDWNGYNILHTDAARVGALDLGFVPGKGGKSYAQIIKAAEKGDIKFTYLLGVDTADVARLEKSFVVYQGHTGDLGAHEADVILPGVAYTEKNATYVNMEGRVQQARKAADAPGDAKDDWRIIRALSDVLGLTLPYDDLSSLRQAMDDDNNIFNVLDEVVPAQWNGAGTEGKLGKAAFESIISTNYYQTNVIARASKTMAECVETFTKQTDKRKSA